MNSYEFAASIELNLPLYAAAPDTCAFALAGQGASFALSEDIRNLEFNIAKKRILAEAVYAVGSCLLLKERIGLEEKRQNLIRKEAQADEKLWLLGRLSTFDLSERNTKRFESYVSLLQMRQNLSHLVENLYMFGLEETSLPSDAALWIACWEAYAAENPIENGLNSALESKQAEKTFITKRNAILRIFRCCGFRHRPNLPEGRAFRILLKILLCSIGKAAQNGIGILKSH